MEKHIVFKKNVLEEIKYLPKEIFLPKIPPPSSQIMRKTDLISTQSNTNSNNISQTLELPS